MEERLPAAIRRVWWIGTLLTAGWWGAVTAVAWLGHTLWHWPLWVVLIGAAVLVLHAGSKALLIPYRYAYWRYRITDTAVYLREGALVRKETAIPISRIQNVTLEAGPILRANGLQEVQIQTAATTDAIAGVTTATAATLRDLILRLAQEARDDA
ncbi:PH domain-containing protein [Lacticaseibacillus absianus]|uniref:PH domain-containing protein n=1 Tax=Lacticaseibacillus absianus TaxID=2729623 RepID=UPI0015CC69B1|nr:PH domain-containing protein [Lacticaseibacillus absianus]